MNLNDLRKITAGWIMPKAKASTSKISEKDLGIITQLAQEFKDRTRKDLQSWVDAKRAAETGDIPRWCLLQDLMDYLKPDGHYGSQVGLRIAATRCTAYKIRDRKSMKEDPEKTKLLKEEWFFNLMGDLLESVMYKYTLVQFPNWKSGNMKYDKIPRRNVVPQKRVLLKEVMGDTAYSIDDPAWSDTFIYAEHQSDFGIMDDIIKDLIWKKNSRESWAEFSEKFGIPLVSATVVTRDKKEIARIQTMLKAMGEAATAVLPQGSNITIHDSAAKGDPYNVYLASVKLANEEISKRIVGGTMISDSGSSYNQGEIHQNGFIMICEEDKKFLEFIINSQLIPKMKGFSENDEFVFDRTERLKLKDMWTIVKEMIEQGADIDPSWISEKFTVPVKSFTKKEPANFKVAPTAMAIAIGATGVTWPNYSSLCSHSDLPVASWKEIPELWDLSQSILKLLWQGKTTEVLQLKKALLTGTLMRDGLMDGWGDRRVTIEYNATDHKALAAMEYNIFHFSCTREKAGVLALNDMLLNKEKLKIESFEDFSRMATPLQTNMNINWLRTEYNFATATAQNASRYNQFLSEKDSVTSFVQYQTVGDDHVRPKHQLLDGRIFSIDDPEARTLWPPNDWECRCEFLQFIGDTKDKVTSGKEGQKLINWTDKQRETFGYNRGDIGEVFTANQQYVKDKGITADINSMSYKDYGLKPIADIKKSKKALQPDLSITPGNVHELFVPVKGETFMGYSDYLERKLVLKDADFKTHTKGKYVKGHERRHQVFPFLNDVITTPDEVYFSDYKNKSFQTRYVKHYGNTSVVVATELGNDNLEIKTWYEINREDNVRNGLLIHQKKMTVTIPAKGVYQLCTAVSFIYRSGNDQHKVFT